MSGSDFVLVMRRRRDDSSARMIDLRTAFLGSSLLLSSVVTMSCSKISSPDEAMAALEDDDLEQRIRAADYLRASTPSEQATKLILKLIVVEKEPRAYGAMLETLGASGVPEAYRPICDTLKSTALDLRLSATKAARSWMRQNGKEPVAAPFRPPGPMDADDFCPVGPGPGVGDP